MKRPQPTTLPYLMLPNRLSTRHAWSKCVVWYQLGLFRSGSSSVSIVLTGELRAGLCCESLTAFGS